MGWWVGGRFLLMHLLGFWSCPILVCVACGWVFGGVPLGGGWVAAQVCWGHTVSVLLSVVRQ